MQEGEESHDSFMASLTSHQDSRSLMPADSAFRMVSSMPAQGKEGGRRLLNIARCMCVTVWEQWKMPVLCRL